MSSKLEKISFHKKLEKASFHSNLKQRQSQKMPKLLHNCTLLTH